MNPYDYHVKIIELAYGMAVARGGSDAETLRRFRRIYRHMAASVDGSIAELGFGPFGPMSGMPGMQQAPDMSKLLEATDKELEGL